VFFNLCDCSLALHGQHSTARLKQRQTPPGQLIERCNSPGRNDVDRSGGVSHSTLLGTPADHGHRKAQEVDGLGEEVSATEQWFDEGDGYIGADEREGNAGQSGATADVGDALPGLQQFADGGAIENVSVPYPGDFTGADQTALDSSPRQYCGVLRGDIQAVTKDGSSGGWRRWRFTMFHVKHPPNPPPAGCHRTTSL
jgi:hypothetical protein